MAPSTQECQKYLVFVQRKESLILSLDFLADLPCKYFLLLLNETKNSPPQKKKKRPKELINYKLKKLI